MTRPATEPRILAALQLQPMTVETLAACLSLQTGTVRRRVHGMRLSRVLRAVNVKPSGHGRPWVVYSVHPFCQPQKVSR